MSGASPTYGEWQPIETAWTHCPILVRGGQLIGEVSGVSEIDLRQVALVQDYSMADYVRQNAWNVMHTDGYHAWVFAPVEWMPLPELPA
jgi:hypothetical protein